MTQQLCVHCGEDIATTEDHIPPQGIYSKSQRNEIELHTVPSCLACNGGGSIADEEFKVVIGFSTGEFRDNQDQVIKTTAKTIGSNQKIADQIFLTKIDGYARLRSSI